MFYDFFNSPSRHKNINCTPNNLKIKSQTEINPKKEQSANKISKLKGDKTEKVEVNEFSNKSNKIRSSQKFLQQLESLDHTLRLSQKYNNENRNIASNIAEPN